MLLLGGLLLSAAWAIVPPPMPVADAGVLDRDLRRWMRDDPCSPVNLAETMPEPAMALALSGLVGHGAGHFYAGRPTAGGLFLFTEGLLTTTSVISGVAFVKDPIGNADADLFFISSASLGLLARIADMATAASSARTTRNEILDDCGW